MARKRKGRQTPTRAVILPYRKKLSKGPEAVELYESTGRTARKWQTFLLADIMAQTPKGLWKHTKFGLAVPRQNGKNEVVLMRELWGLKNGEHIIHTAHRTDTAHKAWERLLEASEKAGLVTVSSYKARGKEHIEVWGGGKVEFRTRTNTGGLGESFDLLVYDEAQELTNDQDAALKYTIAASENPQIILIGTPPTPISAGTVFRKFREQMLKGRGRESGWAEWSVERETDPWDKEAWYETNPSLGQGLQERTISSEIGDDVVDFNIQRLGLWIEYNLKSAFTKKEWERLKCDKLPKLQGRLYVGIKYNREATNVSMAIAARTEDGRIFTEAIDCRETRGGNAWILQFLKSLAGHAKRIVVDGASGQELLAKEMKEEKIQRPYLPTVREVTAANAFFEAQVFGEMICHMGQPSLCQIAENCDHRAIGTNGGFGYKSILEGADISLLDAVILACWAVETFKESPSGQKMSY